MSRDEALYNLGLARQKMVAQRKLYAQALNKRDDFLATIEHKTYEILLKRYNTCIDEAKPHLPLRKAG